MVRIQSKNKLTPANIQNGFKVRKQNFKTFFIFFDFRKLNRYVIELSIYFSEYCIL